LFQTFYQNFIIYSCFTHIASSITVTDDVTKLGQA